MAADFAADLDDGGSAEMVREALGVVAGCPPDDYLDSDAAAAALAAAEFVAAAGGRPLEPSPDADDVIAWAGAHPEVSTLAPLALVAIDRLASPESELLALWEDAGDDSLAAWRKAVNDVRSRIAAPSQDR